MMVYGRVYNVNAFFLFIFFLLVCSLYFVYDIIINKYMAEWYTG